MQIYYNRGSFPKVFFTGCLSKLLTLLGWSITHLIFGFWLHFRVWLFDSMIRICSQGWVGGVGEGGVMDHGPPHPHKAHQVLVYTELKLYVSYLTRGWHLSIAHTTLWFHPFLMVFTGKLLWCLPRLNACPLYALYHTWLLISELQIDPYAVSCFNPQVLSGYGMYTHLGFNRPTLLP